MADAPQYQDDYHHTQNLDYAIRHGRRALIETTASLARDITNSAVEDIAGLRTAKHSKEQHA